MPYGLTTSINKQETTIPEETKQISQILTPKDIAAGLSARPTNQSTVAERILRNQKLNTFEMSAINTVNNAASSGSQSL